MLVTHTGTSSPNFVGFTFFAFQMLVQDTELSTQDDSQISSSLFSPPSAIAFGIQGFSARRSDGWIANVATDPSAGEKLWVAVM